VSRHLAKLLPVLLIVLTAGCGGGKSASPTQPVVNPLAGMPTPGTPTGVVRALGWAWNQRSVDAYELLFTSDYRFTFSLNDSAGARWRTDPWSRDDEMASFACLVHGGDANQPAADSIALQLDRNFVVLSDPRPGMNNARRKSITTAVNLTIWTHDGAATNIFGNATFYLVRGDLAAIPPEQAGPDSTRWYVDGWLDGTEGTGVSPARAGAPTPAKTRTWGSLKASYEPASMRPGSVPAVVR